MALSARQKLFFFVGLNIALYGLTLTIMGIWHLHRTWHGASGVAAWCGIVLIMCGIGDIIISIDSDEKDFIGGFSIGAMVANLIAMFFSMIVIGFSSWAAEDDLTHAFKYGAAGDLETNILVYVTVVLLGAFAMILSLIALLFDCCCNGVESPLGVIDGNPYPEPYYPRADVYPSRYR